MFTGNEWLWILVIVVVIGAAAAIAVSSQRRRPVIAQSARVQGAPDEVVHDIFIACANRSGLSVYSWSDGILLLERRTLPGWSVVLALLAFPIGLLALMARNIDAGTIVATTNADDTTELQFRGRFDPRDIARINLVVTSRS